MAVGRILGRGDAGIVSGVVVVGRSDALPVAVVPGAEVAGGWLLLGGPISARGLGWSGAAAFHMKAGDAAPCRARGVKGFSAAVAIAALDMPDFAERSSSAAGRTAVFAIGGKEKSAPREESHRRQGAKSSTERNNSSTLVDKSSMASDKESSRDN